MKDKLYSEMNAIKKRMRKEEDDDEVLLNAVRSNA